MMKKLLYFTLLLVMMAMEVQGKSHMETFFSEDFNVLNDFKESGYGSTIDWKCTRYDPASNGYLSWTQKSLGTGQNITNWAALMVNNAGGYSSYCKFKYENPGDIDNWVLDFDVSFANEGMSSQRFYVVNSNSTEDLAKVGTLQEPVFMEVYSKSGPSGRDRFTVKLASMTVNQEFQLAAGRYYHFTLKCTEANTQNSTLSMTLYEDITNDNGDVTGMNEMGSASTEINGKTFGNIKGFYMFNKTGHGEYVYDNIKIQTRVMEETVPCENPVINIEGSEGKGRYFTLSTSPEEAEIFWSEIANLGLGEKNWTKYDGKQFTNSPEIYAYAQTRDGVTGEIDAYSDIVALATTAGSAVALDPPFIRNAEAIVDAEDAPGIYNVWFEPNIKNNNVDWDSDLNYAIWYSIGDDDEFHEYEEGEELEVPEGSKVRAYAVADGYEESQCANRHFDYRFNWQDYYFGKNEDGEYEPMYYPFINIVGYNDEAYKVILDKEPSFYVGEMPFYAYHTEDDDGNVNEQLDDYSAEECENFGIKLGVSHAEGYSFSIDEYGDGHTGLANKENDAYIGLSGVKPGWVLMLYTYGTPLVAGEGVTYYPNMSDVNGGEVFLCNQENVSIKMPKSDAPCIASIAVRNAYDHIEMKASGIGTFVSPFPLDFSKISDYKAYIATSCNFEDSFITINPVKQIPGAEVGGGFNAFAVIGPKKQSEFILDVPYGRAGDFEDGKVNLFRGSPWESITAEKQYTVYYLNTSKYFVPAKVGTVIPAGKAYVFREETNASSRNAKGFLYLKTNDTPIEDIDTVTTDVEEVKSSGKSFGAKGTRYNVLGQKVGKSYHGMVVNESGDKFVTE